MKGLHPIWGELKISIKTSIKNKKSFLPNCVRYFSALTKLINSSHFKQINIWATVLNQKAFHLIAQNSAGNYRRNGYKKHSIYMQNMDIKIEENILINTYGYLNK